MSFWLLTIIVSFCEFICTLFYNESFTVAMYEGSHRATEQKCKQIFEHFI